MADERTGGVVDLWRSQLPEGFRTTPEEIRKRSEQMEKATRRKALDFYLTFVLVSAVIIFMATLSPSPAQTLGAILTIAALAWLAIEVDRLRASRTAGIESGSAASIDFHREQLRRQLDFARAPRVWTRVLFLTPGPLLFFAAYANAHPNLATFMYVQIATFILIIIAIVPLARRMQRKVQQQLDELDRLV